jgi:hypothetical protein
MFITPQSIQAETAYRQERTKRQFRSTTRPERQERAPKAQLGPVRRFLHLTHPA